MGVSIDIQAMSVQERLELIEQLWDSIEHENPSLTPAQMAELERRIATLDQTTLIPWEQVRAKLHSLAS